MLHLQGEFGCKRQDARIALQAHIPPTLLEAMAGNNCAHYIFFSTHVLRRHQVNLIFC